MFEVCQNDQKEIELFKPKQNIRIKKKKVFPNQVSLEIRRFLTYKRRRISDDLSNRIVMSNELTASNKCLLREFMEAHCTELKELH